MTTGENNSAQELHVVLGGGQIGNRLASLLAASHRMVRVVQRTARTDHAANITRLSGDIREPDFAEAATRGATVVYDCMNPAYDQWDEQLLPIARGALHGARAAGARLVALDCLYMYGVPDGAMREDSPRNPCSRKGALRVQLEALRMAAQQRGDVQVAIGRGSDFYGYDVPLSLFGPRFFERVLAGKAVECFGDPDMPHAYTYADDVARGLMVLGADARAPGAVWHLPTAPAESTRALMTRVADALHRPLKLRVVPRWFLSTLGLVVPMAREAAEMVYQWEVPYLLDDSRFRSTFGITATPVEQAVAKMAHWAQVQYGLTRAA